MTRAHSHIRTMAPYALADLSGLKDDVFVSLSQNESLRPPSPKVAEAILQALGDGMLYPDPDWTELRYALAEHHAVSPNRILCGNGSLNLIGALAQVFAGKNRSVLAPAHAYPFFKTAAQMAGARFDQAPEKDAVVSVDTLLARVQEDTGMVCVANPGNPTGTRISKEELLFLRKHLREDILLVIDEAYGEFADHLGERCFDMVEAGNTVVLRTFSKAYGLAGYRVGWGVFPETIGCELRKVVNPNNVAHLSQIAARVALEDQGYMQETCALTHQLRDAFSDRMRAIGIGVFRSYTNFVLIDCETVVLAEKLDQALIEKGVILRRQSGAGLPHTIRMTIGEKAAMETVATTLTRRGEL